MPAPYSSKTVANSFLKLAEEHGVTDMSPMKLQKLVYYAHAWFMAYLSESLIEDEIQAWKYGPVIPDIYHAFKRFGNDHITSSAVELSFIDNTLLNITAEVPQDDQNAIGMIREVFKTYGRYTPIQLSNLTHSEGEPWKAIYDQYPDDLPSGLKIPDELIDACFKKKLAEFQETQKKAQA